MDRLKVFTRNQLIDFLFSETWRKINVHECMISVIYLINLCDVNIYVNIFVLVCAMIHKQNIETYLVNRFISLTILLSTVFLRLFSLYTMLCLVAILVAHDIYKSRWHKKMKTTADHQNIEMYFMMEHEKYTSSDNNYVNIFDDCDDDDDYDDGDDDYKCQVSMQK